MGTVGVGGLITAAHHLACPRSCFFKKEMSENRREGQGAGARMRSMFSFQRE